MARPAHPDEGVVTDNPKEPGCDLRVEWRNGAGEQFPLRLSYWRDVPMSKEEADATIGTQMKQAGKVENAREYRAYLRTLLRWATEPQVRHYGRMVAWGERAGLVVADDGSIHRLQFDWLRACPPREGAE